MKHNWLIRASQVSDIMTNDRSGKQMGDTAKKAILEAVLFNKYGIEPKEISSKFIEKGNANEYENIVLAKRVLNWADVDPDLIKPRLFNDYVTGETDVLSETVLADIKTSWDASTFPWLAVDCPNKAYYWQMQVYCWLTDRDEAELVYALSNTPENLIYDELRKAVWKNLTNPLYAEKSETEIEEILEEKIRGQLTFDQIPEKNRVKRFIIKRDDMAIEQIKARVIEAREYYDQLFEKI
ncbi:hypothetical protein UFOVP611_30 [uncultured Caudovirales phage]|uniref:Uncharacterized protein n=1 Tax=uncultured Caudovirales phage TaxID=2100421 RepID=A0A6J5N619_9CAUD|nr:hypothetical protein UFOVP611_30 [uncultured Caudovirales phage]